MMGRGPRRSCPALRDSAGRFRFPSPEAAAASNLRVMPPTIDQALRGGFQRLAKLGCAHADAEELLSRLLDRTRAGLYLERDRTLAAEESARFDAWLARRALGEPVQYITGRAAFRGLDLQVSPAVLIPRPETEGLVEAVLGVLRAEETRWPNPRVLDLGTGSGAVALAIAHEWPAAKVTATDASAAALQVAGANVRALGLDTGVRLVEGDWFGAVGADEQYEIIVSNPPYIATREWDVLPEDVRGFEPWQALISGASGLEAPRQIVDQAPLHLVPHGLLALELAEERAREVAGWLEGAHEWSDVRLIDDLAGRPRVLLARRRQPHRARCARPHSP